LRKRSTSGLLPLLGFASPLWHTWAQVRQPQGPAIILIESNPAPDAAAWIDRFGDETLTVVCRALGAQWGSFYRIGSNLRPFGFRTFGIPREFGLAYKQNAMENVDPLHPVRLVPRKPRFLTMGDARAHSPDRYRDFQAFLRSFGAQEAGEMIFHSGGQAVAGLSLVWTGQKPEYRATAELGSSLHSYVEFNLDTGWRMRGLQSAGTREALARGYELTGRETEVVDAVCRGLTNDDIARQLNIGLATVKTHLIHVFKKVGVETRGGLISRVLAGRH
jgi:DNA-binding CsgD family transcriptional regulator